MSPNSSEEKPPIDILFAGTKLGITVNGWDQVSDQEITFYTPQLEAQWQELLALTAEEDITLNSSAGLMTVYDDTGNIKKQWRIKSFEMEKVNV